MSKKLVFATNNKHKLSEVKQMLKDRFDIVGLEEIGCAEEIPETAPDLQGNALLKAKYVKEKYGYDCFADDTGLEVEALNNEPGVYSARYAGEEKSADKNIDLLLKKLQDKKSRKARFRTVICLIEGENKHFFEGIVNGEIIQKRAGNDGFGYDPVFVPEGFKISFAEMTPDVKNSLSHRGRAVEKLIQFLNQIEI